MIAPNPQYIETKQGMRIYQQGDIRFGVDVHSIDDGFRGQVFYRQLRPTRFGRIDVIRDGSVSVTSGCDHLPLILGECQAFNSGKERTTAAV